MLNITENSINDYFKTEDYKAFGLLSKKTFSRTLWLMSIVILLLSLAALFLPWTQNINAKGSVTTLSPSQRPQAIQSIIAGKLEKWYVQEGSFVKKGDTVVFITDVKAEYFDPDLLERTAEQVDAKSESIRSYSGKVRSLEGQYLALQEARDFKIEQTENKIIQTKLKMRADSMNLLAYQTNYDIAQKQLDRTLELYDKGLKSLTDLEEKKLKIQETQAKISVQENKLLSQKNELLNLQIDFSGIKSDYADKLAKSQSDKFSAQSSKLNATADASKLRNKLGGYTQRQEYYYITAPQSGYVTKIIKKGIGEIIKEGTDILTIMPSKYDLAVEIYVQARDLPLLEIGSPVRIQFDGWPAVIFSGWPNSSFGTFSGKVNAIDQFISENGRYRLMVSPDQVEKKWPSLVRVGSGAKAFILLNDVPIWYELWRQLNGFPPDFYEELKKPTKEIKQKAPIKSVK